MTEAVLQNLILARLGALGTPDGPYPGRVWVWRMNTGAMEARAGRVVRFGIPGQADITGVVMLPSGAGLRLEIECKSEDGRLRPAQREYGERMQRMGALYIVARTLEDALGPVEEALRG